MPWLFTDYLDNLFEPSLGLDGGPSFLESVAEQEKVVESHKRRGRGVRKPAKAAPISTKADASLYDDEDDVDEDGDDDDALSEHEGGKRIRPSDPVERVARSRERNRLHARKSRLRKLLFCFAACNLGLSPAGNASL